MKMLIVDDDLAVKEVMVAALSNFYDVESADTGEIALHMLDKEVFDLVLTDFMMSPIDGMAVCQSAKRISDHTKTIVISGGTDIRKEIIEADSVDGFLPKPSTILEMKETIDCVMAT